MRHAPSAGFHGGRVLLLQFELPPAADTAAVLPGGQVQGPELDGGVEEIGDEFQPFRADAVALHLLPALSLLLQGVEGGADALGEDAVASVDQFHPVLIGPDPGADLHELHHGGHIVAPDVEQFTQGLHLEDLGPFPDQEVALEGLFVVPFLLHGEVPVAVHPAHVLRVGLQQVRQHLPAESVQAEGGIEPAAVIGQFRHLMVLIDL